MSVSLSHCYWEGMARNHVPEPLGPALGISESLAHSWLDPPMIFVYPVMP